MRNLSRTYKDIILRSILVLIFFACSIKATELHCAAKSIKSSRSEQVEIIWPQTKANTYSVSVPICWSTTVAVKLMCLNGNWESRSFDCVHYTVDNNPIENPLHYDELEDGADGKPRYFRLINESTSYSNLCFSPILDTSSATFRDILNGATHFAAVNTVWLGHMSLLNPSSMDEVKVKWDQNMYKGRECVALDLQEKSVYLRNCEDKLPTLCSASAREFFIKLACPDNQYAYRFSGDHDVCYEIKILGGTHSDLALLKVNATELFEPVTRRDIQFFQQLKLKYPKINSNAHCLVNLEKLKIVDYDVNKSIGTISMYGTAATNKPYDCIVKGQKIEVQTPTMELKFVDNELKLSVNSIEFLFREDDDPNEGITCFFNSQPNVFKLANRNQFRMDSVSRTMFTVTGPDNPFPKRVWCEAYAMKTMQLISTTRVTVPYDKASPIYALKLNMSLKQEQFGILLYAKEKALEEIDSNLDGLFSNVSLFAILSYNEVTIIGEFLFHLQNNNDTYKEIRTTLKEMGFNTFVLNSFNSCMPESLDDRLKLSNITFDEVKVGERSFSNSSCLDKDKRPYSIRCLRDEILGAVWEDLNNIDDIKCHKQPDPEINIVTNQLEVIVYEMTPEKATNAIKEIVNITQTIDTLIPINFVQIAEVLQKEQEYVQTGEAKNITPDAITNVINNIMNVHSDTIKNVSHLGRNTTNIFLDSLEQSAIKAAAQGSVPFNEKGVHTMTTPNLILCTVNPLISNFSGLALYSEKDSPKSNSSDLTDYTLKYIKLNDSMDDIIAHNSSLNLEIATYLPQKVFDELRAQTADSIIVVIQVFLNDKLFQSETEASIQKVISMSIPDHKGQMPGLVPTYTRGSAPSAESHKDSCRFWSFVTKSKPALGLGEWNTNGCEVLNNSSYKDVNACGCNHLTHFAFLITGAEELPAFHNDLLNSISMTLSILSLICLLILIVLFSGIKRFRKDLNKQIIVHFSFAIGVQLISLVVIEYTKDASGLSGFCIWMGTLLHYSTLTTFTWMFVLALRQYRIFVTIFASDTSDTFYRYSVLLAWGSPAVVALLTRFLYTDYYKLGVGEICYPKKEALVYGVMIPVITVLLCNVVVFIAVIRNIFKKSTVTSNIKRSILPQLKITITVFFILGLTWIFGLTITVTDGMIRTVLTYVFCVLTPLQGIILFLFNVVLNKPLRDKIAELINSSAAERNKRYGAAMTSLKSTTVTHSARSNARPQNTIT